MSITLDRNLFFKLIKNVVQNFLERTLCGTYHKGSNNNLDTALGAKEFSISAQNLSLAPASSLLFSPAT